MDAHKAAVLAISERVKDFYQRKEPFRLYHGSTSSTRQTQRRSDNTIDTSSLNHILGISTADRWALVEPNVPMDALVKETMKYGLIPPVVMEFPGITAGGGFSGTSGESSSFRFGPFEANVRSIEIVTPNGEIMTASKTERPDLFWGATSALGTLGVVTLLKLELINSKRYVALTYHPTKSMAETVNMITEETSNKYHDYVDAIVFSSESAVVCTGRLVQEPPKGTQPIRLTRRQDKWFYLRAQDVLKASAKQEKGLITEYFPTVDYFFRYDRGAFWTARYVFRYFLMPFNRITRFALNSFMYSRVMYSALHRSYLPDFYLLQDVGIPFDKAVEFHDWLRQEVNIYPLWLCPLKIKRDTPDAEHGIHSYCGKPDCPDLLNFGVWGPLAGDRQDAIRQNREVERKVHELRGQKCLYAHAYYTEDEFWENYDKKSYDALRAKYDAEHLPSVYDKVKTDLNPKDARAKTVRTHWPMPGLKGVYQAIVGGDYLLEKKARKDKTAN